jgi:hypothetical protein
MTDEVTTNACARERKPRVEFSEDMLLTILDRIANGESLNKICSTDDMPTRKCFFDWVAKDPTIRDRYDIAISMRADHMAEEILDIADDGRNDTYTDDEGEVRTDHDVIARSRLRVDARKWLASKMAPKKYGDKVAIGGSDDMPPVQIERIERVIVRPKD